jgi:hypothetical protein
MADRLLIGVSELDHVFTIVWTREKDDPGRQVSRVNPSRNDNTKAQRPKMY